MGQVKHNPQIGDKYGQWTVISTEIKRHSEKKSRTAYFHVRCQCGKEGWRAAHTLITGTTKSCKSCARTSMHENTFNLSYLNRVKDRAKRANLNFDIDANYIYNLYKEQKGKCALSGLQIFFRLNWKKNEQTASLDRIDNKQGYIKGNVQWVHKDINNMKYTYSTEYFKFLCYAVNRYGSSKCG